MLISMIIELLGSNSSEQQETASRTLGELCKKNGDRILAEIMPILRDAVSSSDSRVREGACTAFTEIMESASDEHIANHEDTIIEAVKKALVDEDTNVRTAAARTFDTMQEYIGTKAIDRTIPTLLEAMGSTGPTSEAALMALREVMSVSCRVEPRHIVHSLTLLLFIYRFDLQRSSLHFYQVSPSNQFLRLTLVLCHHWLPSLVMR